MVAKWNRQPAYLRFCSQTYQSRVWKCCGREEDSFWDSDGWTWLKGQKILGENKRLFNILQGSKLCPGWYVLPQTWKQELQAGKHNWRTDGLSSWFSFQHDQSLGRWTILIRCILGTSITERHHAILRFHVQWQHLPINRTILAERRRRDQTTNQKGQELSRSDTLVRK